MSMEKWRYCPVCGAPAELPGDPEVCYLACLEELELIENDETRKAWEAA